MKVLIFLLTQNSAFAINKKMFKYILKCFFDKSGFSSFSNS